MEGDEVHGTDGLVPAVGSGHLLPDDPRIAPVLRHLAQLAQTLDDQPGVDLEQLHGIGDQPLLRQKAVPLVGGLRQRVLQAGLHALGTVVRDADRLGDLVGGEEADAPDVGGELVGAFLHDGDRRVAVLLVDPHGDGGGHLDGLQEEHDLLDRLLFLPGVGDLLGAFGAETGDLDEALGLLLDDPQGVDAEVLGDAVGEDRPDALDQPGPQIAPDALDGGRQHGRVVLDVELLAVLRMRPPAALHPEGFTDLGTEQRADHREEIPGTSSGVDPGHRVPVLLIGVRDPLQHAFDHGKTPFAGLGPRLLSHDPTVPVRSDTGPPVRSLPVTDAIPLARDGGGVRADRRCPHGVALRPQEKRFTLTDVVRAVEHEAGPGGVRLGKSVSVGRSVYVTKT